MDYLISRADAIDVLIETIAPPSMMLDTLVMRIEAIPSAQPQRQTGRWEITKAYPHNVYCSVCHKKFAQTHWAVWEDGSLPRKFCPNCGAKMEVEHE